MARELLRGRTHSHGTSPRASPAQQHAVLHLPCSTSCSPSKACRRPSTPFIICTFRSLPPQLRSPAYARPRGLPGVPCAAQVVTRCQIRVRRSQIPARLCVSPSAASYLGGEPGCPSYCGALRSSSDVTGWGVWNYRARRKAQVSLLPCFSDGYGAVPDAHLPHMHPNYLLDSQNAAAPGAHAALPRAALARNVLRAGERDARRQVLRAAGLMCLPGLLAAAGTRAHAPRAHVPVCRAWLPEVLRRAAQLVGYDRVGGLELPRTS